MLTTKDIVGLREAVTLVHKRDTLILAVTSFCRSPNPIFYQLAPSDYLTLSTYVPGKQNDIIIV